MYQSVGPLTKKTEGRVRIVALLKANSFYVFFLESLRGVDDSRTLENFLYDDFDDDMYGYYEMAMFLAQVACYN
jgi:hypothetical protein